MEYEAEVIVPKGTTINIGRAAPQGAFPGGVIQILLPAEWYKNGWGIKTRELA